MLRHRWIKQTVRWLVLAVLVVVAVVILRKLDQSDTQAGLWVFIGLTLTTGFFHGALDIVLLQREFVSRYQLATALTWYAGSALLLAMLCAQSGWLLVLLLLVMSVWHFGEPYGRWEEDKLNPRAWLQRVIAGGAPVMLPALLSGQALQTILPTAVGIDAELAFTIWQGLAWLWLGIGGLGIAVLRKRLFSTSLLTEVSLVLVINLLLSPLMAFSIYFGVFHAMVHIFRFVKNSRHPPEVEKKNGIDRASNQQIGLAIALTSVATLLLFLILFWWLQGVAISADFDQSLLYPILVGLTSVTFPHLILVSRHSQWLAGLSS